MEDISAEEEDTMMTPLERFRSIAWRALYFEREKKRAEKEAEFRQRFDNGTPLERFRLLAIKALEYERALRKEMKKTQHYPTIQHYPTMTFDEYLESDIDSNCDTDQFNPDSSLIKRKKLSVSSTVTPRRRTSFRLSSDIGRNLSSSTAMINNAWEPDEQPRLIPSRKITDFASAASIVTGTNKAANIMKARASERKRLNAALKLKDRMRQLVQERLTVKEIFQKYVESSTLHGFVYTCSDTFFIRRFIWACLMILGAIYFLFKFKDAIVLFGTYPFSTLATLAYVDKLQLPAISFCLVNQYNTTRLNQTDLRSLNQKNWLPIGRTWKYPGFDIAGQKLKSDIEFSSYSMEDIHAECDFIRRDTDHPMIEARRCGTENFTTFFSKSGQLCYTLNSGLPGHQLLNVDQEGLNNGYELIIDLKNHDTLKLFDYTGMQIRVHDQNEPPVSSSGFFIAPGSKTIVRLDKTETQNLPPPYGTECGEVPLKYHGHYNQKACILEKEAELIGKICGCRELYMPDTNLPYCSVKQMSECTFAARERLNFDALRKECPANCKEITYHTKLSSCSFLHNPPKGVETILLENAVKRKGENTSYLLELKKKYNDEELGNYIEENIIVVLFYYGEMSKAINIQEATFTFYNFLGDAGGNFGLMLGASLLTFVEFIDLFIFLVYHQLLRLQKRKMSSAGSVEAVKEKEGVEMNQLA